MGVTIGLLGWPPASFWAATTHELAAAFEARAEAYGRAPTPSPAVLRRLIESHPARVRSIRPAGQPRRRA